MQPKGGTSWKSRSSCSVDSDRTLVTPSLSKSSALIAPLLQFREQYLCCWPVEEISHKWTILSLHPVAKIEPDGWNWRQYTSSWVQSYNGEQCMWSHWSSAIFVPIVPLHSVEPKPKDNWSMFDWDDRWDYCRCPGLISEPNRWLSCLHYCYSNCSYCFFFYERRTHYRNNTWNQSRPRQAH